MWTDKMSRYTCYVKYFNASYKKIVIKKLCIYHLKLLQKKSITVKTFEVV